MRITFLILFLFTSSLGICQNPYTFTIDKTNGLPSNSVFDVYQDKQGFMWFATGKGLCRYDGTNIKHFSNEKQTSKSGSCIAEDKMGRIWYENFDGYLYYVENNQLKSLEGTESCGYFRFGIINKWLFALQRNEIKIFDISSLKLKKNIKTKFRNIHFTYATEKAFYVFEKQLYVFDEAGTQTIVKLPANFKEDFPSPIVQKYQSGLIICSKFNSDYLLYENGTFRKFTINYPVEFIQNCAVYGNEIWFCTPKGVLKVDATTSSVHHYFKENTISYIFKDSQNNYWVSTLNQGVFFIEDFETQLYPLYTTPLSITNNGTNVYTGTERDELFEFNTIDKKVKNIFKGNSNHPISPLYIDSTSKNTYFTSSKFRILKEGKLDFEKALAIKDVFQLDKKYLVFAATNNSGFIELNSNIKSDWDNLFQRNIEKKATSYFTHNWITDANGKATVYNSYNQTIYFATNRGLIAQTKKERKTILHEGNSVFFLRLKNYKNLVYALSSNEKLFVIDTNNKITAFILPDELALVQIENIKIQREFLYLFTTDGIFEYNLDTKQYQNVLSLTKDISVTDLSLLHDKLYFASSKGILIKDRLLAKAKVQPKLIINTVALNDQVFDIKEAKNVDYKENNLKIDFSILSFIPNKKHTLLYKINDSKWHRLEPNSQTLNLFSLSPDEYKILLKTEENTGQQPISIVFTINNPFWKTNLFMFFIVLTGFSFIYFLYHIKLNEIRRKNQLQLEKINLEKNLNQSKLKAIKSQMNPHFFYNALNTIQSYILSNDKKKAVTYLSKFSNLTRTILEMTEKESLSIAEEANTLSLYLDIEQARFEEDFSYKIIVDPTIDAENIKMPTMLLQPYVENAVKHGLLHKIGEKVVTIHFEKEGGHIKISIEDNGIGRQKSAELNAIKNKHHNSFATKATENRVTLLNQFNQKNISIQYMDKTTLSGQAKGTTVVIEIPITY